MAHKFVYVTGNHGQLIRACENCICTAVYNSNLLVWEPVKESGTDKYIRGTDACNGTPSEAKKPVTNDSKTTGRAKVNPCYCEECKGRNPHWQDDPNCYCKQCRGKKSHY